MRHFRMAHDGLRIVFEYRVKGPGFWQNWNQQEHTVISVNTRCPTASSVVLSGQPRHFTLLKQYSSGAFVILYRSFAMLSSALRGLRLQLFEGRESY